MEAFPPRQCISPTMSIALQAASAIAAALSLVVLVVIAYRDAADAPWGHPAGREGLQSSFSQLPSNQSGHREPRQIFPNPLFL